MLRSNLLQLGVPDGWVFLGEFLLLSCEVVKRALVLLGLPMAWAEHEATLARQLDQPDFLLALPALASVSLHRRLGGQYLVTCRQFRCPRLG